MKRSTLLNSMFTTALTLISLAAAQAQFRYRVQDIGTLGGNYTAANGVSMMRHVVGTSQTSRGDYHAFLWYQGRMTDLGTLGGTYSSAAATAVSRFIPSGNEAFVVGSASDRAGRTRAFIWDSLYRMRDIGTLGGVHSAATAVNNAGFVVGHSQDAQGNWQAFVFHPTYGRPLPLGTLGGSWSIATGINSNKVIVGYSQTRNGEVHGFMCDRFGMRDIGFQYPQAIDDAGNITGQHLGFGFVYQVSNRMTYYAQNSTFLAPTQYDGYTAGMAMDSSYNSMAVLFRVGTGNLDLNRMIPGVTGWRLQVAVGMFDSQYVVCNGNFIGNQRACLLTRY